MILAAHAPAPCILCVPVASAGGDAVGSAECARTRKRRKSRRVQPEYSSTLRHSGTQLSCDVVKYELATTSTTQVYSESHFSVLKFTLQSPERALGWATTSGYSENFP